MRFGQSRDKIAEIFYSSVYAFDNIFLNNIFHDGKCKYLLNNSVNQNYAVDLLIGIKTKLFFATLEKDIAKTILLLNSNIL